MSENNNDNNQNVIANNTNVDAEVIGHLRKEKIGRPLLVFEILILLLVVIAALPLVNSMLEDENSFLYKVINGNTGGVYVPPINDDEKEEFVNGAELQPLVNSTKMKYENIIMSNFSVNNDTIICKVYSYNGIIDFDSEPYYFEVYSNSNNLLSTIKLTGSYDYEEKEIALSNRGLSFNTGMSYFGKIVLKSDTDYPQVTIESDESGIGSLTCSKDNHKIEYVFVNNYLTKIIDREQIVKSSYTDSEYLNLKKKYETKKNNLGSRASVQENDLGLLFYANIDLEEYTIPDTVKDNNYHILDTEAKVVSYVQEGKGFDCK